MPPIRKVFNPRRRFFIPCRWGHRLLPCGVAAFLALGWAVHAPGGEKEAAFTTGVAMGSLQGTPGNLPGRLNGEVFVTPGAHFAYYAAKGFDHVRIEASWERMQPELNGPLGARLLDHYDDPDNPLRDPVALVRHYLDLAHKNNLSVILDLCHNYGRRRVGYRDDVWPATPLVELGSVELPVDAFVDYSVRIVREFGSHPAVAAVELMNEPYDLAMGEAGWRDACQRAINGIREVDRSIWIVVDGYGWASAEYWPERNPTLHLLRDPADRLIWSAHVYFDDDGSGIYAGDQRREPSRPDREDLGAERLAPFVEWLAAHHFQGRGHIGEFGAPDTDAWRPVLQRFIQAARDAGLRLTAHQDVPYPNSDYIMSLFPVTDPDGRIMGPDKSLVNLLAPVRRPRAGPINGLE